MSADILDNRYPIYLKTNGLCMDHSRTRSSLETGFDPCTPLLFDLYHYLEKNGYFWLAPEHAPGPSSQVLPSCRVRHPSYSKKLFVQHYSVYAKNQIFLHRPIIMHAPIITFPTSAGIPRADQSLLRSKVCAGTSIFAAAKHSATAISAVVYMYIRIYTYMYVCVCVHAWVREQGPYICVYIYL